MNRDVQAVSADETIQAAAQIMADLDTGAVPVGTDARLEGIITDRDIVVRIVAQGRHPTATLVRDVMSSDIITCGEDAPAAAVRQEMMERQIRRMPVVDGERRMIGMVSLDDIVAAEAEAASG